MRYIGIDFGEARIGIAVSDPEGRIAFPRETIVGKNREEAIRTLGKIIVEEEVSVVIVGLPLALNGKETQESQKVRRFAQELRRETSISFEFENEMFTTRMAEQSGIVRPHQDEAAAALILQSYLDRTRRG